LAPVKALGQRIRPINLAHLYVINNGGATRRGCLALKSSSRERHSNNKEGMFKETLFLRANFKHPLPS